MNFLDLFRPKWKNSNPEVRKSAIYDSVHIGGPPRLKPNQLAKLALTDSDEDVRSTAIFQLGQIGDQETIAQVAREAKTPHTRKTAFYYLHDPLLFFKVISTEPRLPFPSFINDKLCANILAGHDLPSSFTSEFFETEAWISASQRVKEKAIKDKRKREEEQAAGAKRELSSELPIAAQKGDVITVKSLLAKGADANVRTTGNLRLWYPDHTSLHIVAGLGYIEIAKALLAHGAKIDARGGLEGRTPLHMVLHDQKHFDMAEWLLANGADPNAADKNGATPFLFAVNRGNAEFVKLLGQYGGRLAN